MASPLCWLRWIGGLALLWTAWRLKPDEIDPQNVHRLILGALAFLVGGGLLWPEIFRVATKPFLLLIDQVFFPGGKLERPFLNLKLPAHYIDEGRYEEALEEYLKILKHYPDEKEAYERAIWLLGGVFKRSGEASKLLRRAKRRGLALDEAITRLAEWGGRGGVG
jgi:tetratricopeptide (TPR) repeat protein